MAWMAKVFGNIYLTEKQGAASFDADDEWASSKANPPPMQKPITPILPVHASCPV
jgi:hypothetical protein